MFRQLYGLLLLVAVCQSSYHDIEDEIEYLKRLFWTDEDMDINCDVESDTCEKKSTSEADESVFSSDPYCDETLGCFDMDGVFALRPINFSPNSREVVNTEFTLFTRENVQNGQMLRADNVSTITDSVFNKENPTKVIVHGFTDSASAEWMEEMNEQLLVLEDMNVIDVGWGDLGASKTFYTQATANIRVVAREIVYLLKTLKEVKGLEYKDVHLIGHSLGAHCVGYVGQNLTGLIERITGLDPAEPYFQGYHVDLRLDSSDAKFVDVIHSDSTPFIEILKGHIGGFGTNDLSGHVDFFPNGGTLQPECELSIIESIQVEDSLYNGLRREFSCDHGRATAYFTESINSCNFGAVVCSDYIEFEKGNCTLDCSISPDHCNFMGYHSFKPHTPGYKKYYLHTLGDSKSYCATELLVSVTLDKTSEPLYGSLEMVFHGKNGISQTLPFNPDSQPIEGGVTRTYVVGLSSAFTELISLEVEPMPEDSWSEVLTEACQLIGLCSGPSPIKIDQVELNNGSGQRDFFCGGDNSYEYQVSQIMFHSKLPCAAQDKKVND